MNKAFVGLVSSPIRVALSVSNLSVKMFPAQAVHYPCHPAHPSNSGLKSMVSSLSSPVWDCGVRLGPRFARHCVSSYCNYCTAVRRAAHPWKWQDAGALFRSLVQEPRSDVTHCKPPTERHQQIAAKVPSSAILFDKASQARILRNIVGALKLIASRSPRFPFSVFQTFLTQPTCLSIWLLVWPFKMADMYCNDTAFGPAINSHECRGGFDFTGEQSPITVAVNNCKFSY